METSVPKLQTFFVTKIVQKKRPRKGGTIFEKEVILKKGVKKGDRTPFSTKKNIAEENLFNRDVVGTAWFCLFF